MTPLHVRVCALLFSVGDLLSVYKTNECSGSTWMGKRQWLQDVFREHGLRFRYLGGTIYNVWLLLPSGGEAYVFQLCDGGFSVDGPHWDYIETVFKPWLQAKVNEQQETDRQRRLNRERETRAKLHHDITAWAAARGPFPSPESDDLQDDWDVLRRVQ